MVGEGPRLDFGGLCRPADLVGGGPCPGVVEPNSRFCLCDVLGLTLLKFRTGDLTSAPFAPPLSGGVIGLASPMSVEVYLGGKRSAEGLLISDVVTATSFSNFDIGTSSLVEECPELPLLPRLMADFSILLAITNSGSSFACRLALRRIIHQKNANEAMRITATGTTIAGIKVLRFDDEEEGLPAAVELCVGVEVVAEADCACVAFALESDASSDE